ncbi:hypothetical protein ACFC18_31025 [Streptomyces sp. NPDC056121]|uniref:hypothetical protein n=1 Tax=Streptomyces sp. NPDC056121 TaxID=3345718 RepID=UPI0035D9334D
MSRLPDPASAHPGGALGNPDAITASWPTSVVSLLLLVVLLAALVALLAKGLRLEEALAVLGSGGLLAAELRRLLL